MTSRPPYCDAAMRVKARAEMAGPYAPIVPYLLDALDYLSVELERSTAYAVAIDAMGMAKGVDSASPEWAIRQIRDRGYRQGLEVAAQAISQGLDNQVGSVARIFADRIRALAGKLPPDETLRFCGRRNGRASCHRSRGHHGHCGYWSIDAQEEPAPPYGVDAQEPAPPTVRPRPCGEMLGRQAGLAREAFCHRPVGHDGACRP